MQPARAEDFAPPQANTGWQLPPGVDPLYGPPPPVAPAERRYTSFGSKTGAVKWEVGAIATYITVTQILVTKETRSFHFQDEGWFGKSTTNLGIDKLTHAFNTYLLTEFLTARIDRKTGEPGSGAITAAVLASALAAYSELYDAHKVSSGFSNQDIISNLAGAGFSVLRSKVPGLKEKLDFRLLVIPNSDIYTFKGKRHYAQQRFLFALQLAGFDGMDRSPLRFVELHAGYYATGFTDGARARGETPQRRPFVGIGINLQELFFRQPRSTAGKVARTTLDYLQVPYTAVHVH